VQFVLTGSILLKHPRFGAQVARELRKVWPGAEVMPLKREGVWGAVELAKRALKSKGQRLKAKGRSPKAGVGVVRSMRQSPTEGGNPRSMKLDKLPLGDAVMLMLSEDANVPKKLLAERSRIERVVRAVVRAFRRGGRLFYVGAGTSGRLGVLDASECPPTFRTPPDMVQGIMAGGQNALWQSLEGGEDDADAGARAIGSCGVRGRDVVVGIAASGTTPFVWGALGEAKGRGATTVLVCFNPFLRIPRALRPAIVIAPNLGPEVLTGSTRLKAGTATKLLLNMFTTLAMVRIGKVRSNLMIDMNPANVKLRDRAVRIVQSLTGADYAAAQQALERSRWVIKRAVARPGWKRATGARGACLADRRPSQSAPGR
jgi:N-acetylmuramic acid 6-phosphate etherase